MFPFGEVTCMDANKIQTLQESTINANKKEIK
jgi:hypothetical protein